MKISLKYYNKNVHNDLQMRQVSSSAILQPQSSFLESIHPKLDSSAILRYPPLMLPPALQSSALKFHCIILLELKMFM